MNFPTLQQRDRIPQITEIGYWTEFNSQFTFANRTKEIIEKRENLSFPPLISWNRTWPIDVESAWWELLFWKAWANKNLYSIN